MATWPRSKGSAAALVGKVARGCGDVGSDPGSDAVGGVGPEKQTGAATAAAPWMWAQLRVAAPLPRVAAAAR